MALKTIDLPSGAKLKIHAADWEDAEALFSAVSAEMVKVNFDIESENSLPKLLKDVVFLSMSSKPVKEALYQCMKKCLYNNAPVTKETWQASEARIDYMPVVLAVAEENIAPFLKGLFSGFGIYMEMMASIKAQMSSTENVIPS